MTARGFTAEQARQHQQRRRRTRAGRFEVKWDDAKKPPKPILPPQPDGGDPAGQCEWITVVFHLAPAHPITSGAHHGPRGADGLVELARLEAPTIRFEPASRINSARTLTTDLTWQLEPDDGKPYPWTDPQANDIARVVRLVANAADNWTVEQEAAGIIATFLQGATEVPVNAHGTAGERYEAAVAIRPEEDNYGRPTRPRYGADPSGELVIRVVDLMATARRSSGGSVPRNWLAARMSAIGWARRRVDGHAMPGRNGRQGPHAAADVYIGRPPWEEAQNR
jgi:hypothetical protein